MEQCDMLGEVGGVNRTQIPGRLQVLRQELLFATEALERYPDRGRPGVIIALGALQNFLVEIYGRYDPKPLIALRQLIYALHDLDRGTTAPLLTPEKLDHRAPDPCANEAFRAFAAAAMELLMKGKVGRLEAARRVAKALRHHGYCNVDHTQITAKNVERWRDSFRAGSHENLAVERFRRLRDDAASSDPIALATKILERLPRVVPRQISEEPPLLVGNDSCHCPSDEDGERHGSKEHEG
jgi:hypothetical protein